MRIAVVGAGASGMMAAITAAKQGAHVSLFEKNDRVGKKLLVTGNGKCNLSNTKLNKEQYYCQDKEKLEKLFEVFSALDAVAFFESIGLMVKEKNGYLYPYSEQASSVLDLLRMELDRTAVQVFTGIEITEIFYEKKSKQFFLKGREKKEYCFDKVILACGSPASLKKGEGMTGYKLAEKLGHRINPIVPGLVQLKSDEHFIKALAGVRCHAALELLIDDRIVAKENGELQFTEYGISGIPVFQFSRLAAYALKNGSDVAVMVDMFPDFEEIAYAYASRLRYESQKDKSLEDYLNGTQNKKINMVMIKQAELKPGMKAEEAGWKQIQEIMQKFRSQKIHINGVNSLENAQVCAGGVDFAQLGTDMQSTVIPGLYVTGELVDVDGKCGGYNLQWAWTSGYVAGKSAAGTFQGVETGC